MTGSRQARSALALATAAILVVGCSSDDVEIPRPRNVLLVSIDTCRPDRLGAYGHAGGVTPNLDALAGESVLFENAYSPVPLTLPAHATLLTGKLPPGHGVRVNIDDRLATSERMLQETLGGSGFATGAVVSSLILGAQFGLSRGFDTYDDELGSGDPAAQRNAEATNKIAIDWLAAHGAEPFFLFVHYYDPHAPYAPPEPFAGRFAEDRYAGEIAYVDQAIGQLLDELRRIGQYETTLVVVTSDHGEMLGEHGEETHGFFIYQSALRIPLIVKPAGPPAARRVERPAGLADVVPTVLAQLGIEVPASVAGEDLSPWLDGSADGDAERAPLYCESVTPTVYGANALSGVVTERWKYIETTRPELYDVVDDPGELRDRMDDERSRADALKGSLAEILAAQGGAGSRGEVAVELDPEERARLESLGYVGGTGTSADLGIDPARDDPKDLVAFHVRMTLLSTLAGQGRQNEAIALGEQLVRERPGFARAWFDVAELAMRVGDRSRAERNFARAVEIDPAFFRAHLRLAVLLRTQQRLDEAIVHLRRAIALEPDRLEPHGLLGVSLAAQGKFDEAAVEFREVLRIDPSDAQAQRYLAEVERQRR